MYKAVHRFAIAAAQDSRVANNPITAAEVPQIDMHVSLLSAMKEIESLDDFTIGKHGICIEKSGRHAVYLPEVAVEQKWTKEETLSALCRKAELSSDAWKEGATFKVYSSVVLSEE
jgi:uncharacterized protein (TIGR00296 family)